MGANPTVISNWFSLLEEIKTKFRILFPCQIWSGDKTGIQNVPNKVKVLGVKKIRTFQQVNGEQGETSTVLTFVNAAGQSVPYDNSEGPMSTGYMAFESPWVYDNSCN